MKSKEDYLKDISYCPKCDGTNINTRRPLKRHGDTTIHHTVECMSCNTKWTDVFTVNDVLGLE